MVPFVLSALLALAVAAEPAPQGAPAPSSAPQSAVPAKPLRHIVYEIDSRGWTETVVKRSGLEGGMSGGGGNETATSAERPHETGTLTIDIRGLTKDGELVADMSEMHENRTVPGANVLVTGDGAIRARAGDNLSGEMAELARYLGRAVFAGHELFPGETWSSDERSGKLVVTDKYTVEQASGDIVTIAVSRGGKGGVAGTMNVSEILMYDRYNLVPLALIFSTYREASQGIDQRYRANSCFSLRMREDSFRKTGVAIPTFEESFCGEVVKTK